MCWWENIIMYLIKIDFICKPLLLIAFLGFSSSVIASEAQPFEGWFVDPYNPTRAIFVSQADPHTEALADLLEARTILAKAELAKIQEDMELSENKEFLNID